VRERLKAGLVPPNEVASAEAQESRQRMLLIETRNQADQTVYAAERMLRDAGDKVSATDRQPVDAAIEEVKRAIEKNDTEAMKRGIETLNTAQHKIAEAMYRSAQSAGAGGGQQSTPGADAGATAGGRESGDVIDAEVVEEEKK
jgi:molecular chaperone DnaK